MICLLTRRPALGEDLDDAMTAYMDAQATLRTGMDRAERIMMQMEVIAVAQEALSDALDGEEISDLAAANEAYGDLETAIEAGDDLTDAEKASAVSDLNMADVTIANAELAMYENAAMADGATLPQMLAAYEGQLAAAQRLADATAASVSDSATANQAIGEATAKIAQLTDDIQDEADDEADKMRLANNDAAMQVADAINAHTTDGDPAIAGVTPGSDVTISRVKETEIELAQNAPVAMADKYSPDSASTIQGWSSAGFKRASTSGKRPVSEIVVAYTDIEEAKNQLWMTAFHIDNAPTGLRLLSSSNGTIEIGGAASLGVFRFTGILPATPALGQETSLTIKANEHQPGTFYGVRGDFECADAACKVTRDWTGKVSVDNTLTFTPDNYDAQTTMATYVNVDTDYTYFGYWMESKTEREGPMSHDIETFHGGMQTGTRITDLSGVHGTANYYGAAAGVYVKKDGADDSLVVTDGKFTAVAELTARFGGPDIAQADDFEVEGTISDFMDGSMDLGFADLTLRGDEADMDGAGFEPTGDEVGMFTDGETDGGGTSGNWSGQFYGNANPGDDGGTAGSPQPDPTNDFPMNVSGEFNGHFVNGHVAGAFGAEYDD